MRKSQLFGLTLSLAMVLAAVGAVVAATDKGNVDELRFGTAVDAEGVVPAATSAHSFLPADSIHVTMQVAEAPAKTKLMLSVMDRESERLVWSNVQPVPGGHANMHFIIPAGAVPPGEYRAKVKLGDDWVAEHEFEIEE